MKCGTKLSEATAPIGVTVPKLEDAHEQLKRSMPKSLAEKFQAVTPDIEGENRILSILYGDISDSVAITEKRSPEEAASLINECLKVMVDIILKYEGSINRFLGDCVLAFFGTPTTHENDPERAILAALEMREAIKKLNLDISIGINTGMVYVGAMGPDEHREFTAMGTAVNLAARLEGFAEPGQILVGPGTYRLAHRAFEFRSLLPLTIRGITEPVSAYEVLQVLPQPEKLRGIEGIRAEMIGREKEFTDLKDCADQLLSGRGQIVSLVGEAGVGKSRLATELKGYIKDKEVRWLEGRGVSIGESIGYWVFIDILRSYLQFSEADSPKDIGQKIIDQMQELFPQRWEEIVPYIGNLLSVKFGNQWDERVKYFPAEQVKYQTFLTLRDVFLALASQKPLLLILEDMHWADNLSLDLLSLLMNDLTLAPLMLLCIYRPEQDHRIWHLGTQAAAKCLDRYTEITLRALNPPESRRLVKSLLRIDNLPEVVKESIQQKAEGNPFFVEELIRSLIDRGIVYRDGSRWVADAEVEVTAVPDTVHSVIMARIDQLEADVRYVLQSAAVIGRLFRHKLLQYITQREQKLDRYLWQLEERDFVYEERAIPELEYSFRHALTQETAYNTILSRRRREFHRKVGEGYEAVYAARIEEYYEELAYHYSRGDDNEKAFYYLVKAGDKSKAAFANEQAIAYYNQALELMDNIEMIQGSFLLEESISRSAPSVVELRGHIHHSLGEIYYLLAKHEAALEFCRKALEYTVEKKSRARIYRIMGNLYSRESKTNLALEHFNTGIAELGDDTECIEMAQIYQSLFWVTLHQQANPEAAMAIAQRGLKIVEGTVYYAEMSGLYQCFSEIYRKSWIGMDRDKAFAYARRSLEAARKSGNSYYIADATFELGELHWFNGEDDVAIQRIREALEIYEKSGQDYGIAEAFSFLGSIIYAKRRDWDGVIECLERCLEISGYAYHAHSLAIPLLAWAYFQRGQTEKAVAYCQRALDVGVNVSKSIYVAKSLTLMETILTKMGNREAFISYCKKFREEKAQELQNLTLNQWYLEPKALSGLFTQTIFADEFDASTLKPEWEWMNPSGDSSYSLSNESNGLEVYAYSGSDLYRDRFDAPRLLQEISGDFAVEVGMEKASDSLPAVSGILVWKDKENYIRFEWGKNGQEEILLSLCFSEIRGFENALGRGMLASDITYLRLERIDDKFFAYCSGDGANWLTCGEVNFPAEDPIQIGIHAIGAIALPETALETATRFNYFRVLKRTS